MSVRVCARPYLLIFLIFLFAFFMAKQKPKFNWKACPELDVQFSPCEHIEIMLILSVVFFVCVSVAVSEVYSTWNMHLFKSY